MDNPKKLFKVLLNEKEAFYIKTLEEESFESFRQQIFKRKPDLENKDFRVYWIGKLVI